MRRRSSGSACEETTAYRAEGGDTEHFADFCMTNAGCECMVCG